jgi:hypothetical protein
MITIKPIYNYNESTKNRSAVEPYTTMTMASTTTTIVVCYEKGL